MSDYYDQTPEQRRQLRAQRNRRRQAQVRRRKLLLGLLVLAVLAVVLILVLRGCGKGKEPAQPTPSENVDKPDTPNTPAEPSDREPNQKPDDQQNGQKQEIPWNLTLVNRWNPLPEGWTVSGVRHDYVLGSATRYTPDTVEIPFEITAGEKTEVTNRVICEMTSATRPTAALIPVVFIG